MQRLTLGTAPGGPALEAGLAVDRRYGDFMLPFDVQALPTEVRDVYAASALVREWMHLADLVMRAEMISSPSDWSLEEKAAYDAGDTLTFSRLRGYSEAEIAEFERFVALCGEVDMEQGDEVFSHSVVAVMQTVFGTEHLRWIDANLQLATAVSASERG